MSIHSGHKALRQSMPQQKLVTSSWGCFSQKTREKEGSLSGLWVEWMDLERWAESIFRKNFGLDC